MTLEEENRELRKELKFLKEQELKTLKELQEVLKIHRATVNAAKVGTPPKKHNERNAGRKTIVTDEIKALVLQCRNEGMPFSHIASKIGISSTLAFKIYHSQK